MNFSSTRIFAHSLLILAFLGFVACLKIPLILTDWGVPVALCKAVFEAALVGGLADWFAVTALFRHPLGIPIPHTAIIPHQKKKIAKAFGNFLSENFLKPEVLRKKLLQISLTLRLKNFLIEQENKEKVVSFLNEFNGVVDLKSVLSSQKSVRYVQDIILQIALSNAGNKFVEAMLSKISEVISEEKEAIKSQISKKLPWFVPSFIDDKIYSWLISSLSEWLESWKQKVAGEGIRCSPQLVAYLEGDKFNELLSEALGSDSVALALQNLTSSSSWRKRVERFVEKLEQDPEFQSKIETVLQRSAIAIATYGADPFSRYISKTIEQWDNKQASSLLENQFGEDLQYIRINGTLLGGIIGGILYLLNYTAKSF